MDKTGEQSFPRWLFAILAISGILASGIFIGIMTVEGLSGMRLVQSMGFGVLGLLMFWGAFSRR